MGRGKGGMEGIEGRRTAPYGRKWQEGRLRKVSG